MDPVDHICATLCLTWQAIGQYYDDPRVLLVFASIGILMALIILHRID